MGADGPPPAGEAPLVQSLLRAGLGLAAVLLASGLAVAALTGGGSVRAVRLFDLLGPLDHGTRLMALGILALAATPVLRVLLLLTLWLRERDLRHAAVAALVLITLLAAVLVGKAG